MCGISVLVDRKNIEVDLHTIKSMSHLVSHRGPDGEGYYLGDHFALGHQMLKITDFSKDGLQPMSYMDYVIVFNGEIYNYKLLREKLKRLGYYFSTQSDTEVILAAYDKWGSHCVQHFNGMWAFVLFDKRKQILYCSRDRMGIKPFCYSQLGNRFAIGSEIKQFTALKEFVPRLNHKMAFNFLYAGKIENNSSSFFEGVHYLPAGHQLVYQLKSHTYTISKWYDIDQVKVNNKIGFEEATLIFKDLFTESMLLHLNAKIPVASCLSGGLDSTAMVGVAKKINSNIATFSSCSTKKGFNEIEYINEAQRHYLFAGHKVYPNINDLLESNLFGKIVYHQDQPILSGSFFSEYKVFQKAALHNYKIVLSGQGADEYLGGYTEFAQLNMLTLFKKGRWVAFNSELKQSAAKSGTPIGRLLKHFLVHGILNPASNKYNFREIRTAPHEYCFNQLWLKEFKQKNIPSKDFFEHSSISNLSKDAILNYSLPHQLHSEDRNAMMHSIESRLPFLDHKLVEWCLTLPDNFIIRNGATKAILREGLKEELPPTIYNRHQKLGFPGPEESLFIHHFDEIQHLFTSYIDLFPEIFSTGLLQLHQDYYKNKIPYNSILFRALAFGAWAVEFGLKGYQKYVNSPSQYVHS